MIGIFIVLGGFIVVMCIVVARQPRHDWRMSGRMRRRTRRRNRN